MADGSGACLPVKPFTVDVVNVDDETATELLTKLEMIDDPHVEK